jgi:GNAT superfamily N-acetyltransferase
MKALLGEHIHGSSSLRVVRSTALPEAMRARVFEIVAMYTRPEGRRQGSASALLRKVCDQADFEGAVLLLAPRPFGHKAMTQQQLADWYMSFEFVPIQSAPLLLARKPGAAPSPIHAPTGAPTAGAAA